MLTTGYARRTDNDGGWVAASASVLLREGQQVVVTDPGGNADTLLAALALQQVMPEDVTTVFLTHGHIDHIVNLSLFPSAVVCDGFVTARGDRLIPCNGLLPGTTMRLLETPGHCAEHYALVAETQIGRVAVAGDLFWWEDDAPPQAGGAGSTALSSHIELAPEALIGLPDTIATDPAALAASRRALLALEPRWIVPGHGGVIRVA
jgi:glyoxylase-like metal-dependent hydrolase (beta-lactamase superfamily II)